MSLYDFQRGLKLACNQENPFRAYLMACFFRADEYNLKVLSEAFPVEYQEWIDRKEFPDNLLDWERERGAVHPKFDPEKDIPELKRIK
jgi:hypothetical protein